MKVMTFVVTCLLIITLFCCCEAQQNTGQIQWQDSYQKALEQSKSSSKPVLLFFTGSDWCGWCSKLEEEALNTQEFVQTAGPQFIFVKLDFPLYSPIDPQIAVRNKELRKKFDVRSFPTIIIVDETGRQIGSTGYRPGGGKEYAGHLIRMVSDYKGYQNRVADLGSSKLTDQDLQKMYEKARQLQRESEANAIIKIGLKESKSSFFLKERYRNLAEEGSLSNNEAQVIKNELLKDKSNRRQVEYDLAMIEFEAHCAEMEKDHYDPEKAVAPLLSYIEKYKQQDIENTWRLQMIISQVFLDNNKLNKALIYAQQSYQSAPASVKPEIALAIENIQEQLQQ